MNTNVSLEEQLGAFGLEKIEAKIYLFLLHKPPQSVLDIARGLNLARTTIYDNGQKLIERGFVERIIKNKNQQLQAMPVSFLETVVKSEKQKAEALDDSFKELSRVLAMPANENTSTQVRYYHGKPGFQQMMWNALSAKDGHIGYSELGRIEIVGEKFLANWMEEMIKRGITDRVILPNTKDAISHLVGLTEKELRAKYQSTRVIEPDVMHISGDTTIYNNVFAVTWWKQGEVVGVEIENAELVKTQKSLFELIWKQAKPFSSKLLPKA